MAAASAGNIESVSSNGNNSESNTPTSKNSDGSPTDDDSRPSTPSIEEKSKPFFFKKWILLGIGHRLIVINGCFSISSVKTNGTESADADNENGNAASKKRKFGDDDFGVETVSYAFIIRFIYFNDQFYDQAKLRAHLNNFFTTTFCSLIKFNEYVSQS